MAIKVGPQIKLTKDYKKPSGKIIKKGTLVYASKDKIREMVAAGYGVEYIPPEEAVVKISKDGKVKLERPEKTK